MNKSPGWVATISLVIAGMLLSSVFTLTAATGMGWFLWGAEGTVSSHSADSASSRSSSSTTAASTAGSSDSWEQTASVIGPSTVSLQVITDNGGAEGSGVVYSADGTVLTNAHVVAGASQVNVTLSNGTSYKAEVIGSDASTDIALVRIVDPPSDLKVAKFADSDDLVVGQDVMAVGTPLGLANTATTGIVSALNRPVVTQGEDPRSASDASFTSAIQTDASVNPGNSGGPLVNRAGEVVGINSSIASNASTSEGAGSIGLGFAIPANTARLIADQLAENGEAQHALLGVRAKDGTEDSGSTQVRGAQIIEVTGSSAAAKAGLKQGDVVTKVDDVSMGSATALTAYIRSLEVGSTHTITFYRDGKEQSAEVTLQGN